MHPVLPSTIVRGPAALAIIFITRADSQPWQVRWPEVKNSSSGSFLTPLMGFNFWVGTSIIVSISFSPRLLAQADPLSRSLLFTVGCLIDAICHPYNFGQRHVVTALA